MGTKVSVIIPVYNVEKYLRDCLECVINQTLKDIEIICVDDGSTDGSLAILREYEAKDRRIHVLTQKNQYAGMARNHGMEIAQGEYFAFWDSDDLFELNALEEMYRHASETKADICLCGSDRFDTVSMQRERMPWMLNLKDVKQEPFCARDVNSIFQVTAPAPWSKLFSAAFIRLHDLHFQDTVRINDMYFVYSALALAEKIVYLDKAFIHYRIGQTENLQSGVTKSPDVCCTVHIKLYERLKDEKVWNSIKTSFYQRVIDNLAFNLRIISTFPEAKRILLDSIDNGYFKKIGLEDATILDGKSKLIYDEIIKEIHITQTYAHIGSHYSDVQTPKVSIIIPVYNVENYLADCLESVINQSFRELEIICINDGSTDDSLTVLEEYAARDDRITVISQRNQGLSMSRNVGLTYVRGEYVQFLDSDDMLELDTVETLYTYAESETLDVVFFGAEVFFENDQLKKKHDNYDNYYSSTALYPKDSGQRLFVRLRHDHVYRESACLQFLRTAFVTSHSLQFYPGIVHEDNLFTFKVCMLATQAAKLDKDFYLRRIRENSIMTTPSDFRNLYGYLITYAQMMAFVEVSTLEPECEKDIIYYVSQIKKRVSQYVESLPSSEMRKASQLSRRDKYLLDQIVLLTKRKLDTPDMEALEQRAALAEQYLDDVHHSVSFRIGRVITWFPRKVRGGVRCLRDNGPTYTFWRTLYHLGIKHEGDPSNY